jgi:hypothetical protein
MQVNSQFRAQYRHTVRTCPTFLFIILFSRSLTFKYFFILYIELCILTLLAAYVFVIDIGLVTAMKLRSAVPTFSLMHVISYKLL